MNPRLTRHELLRRGAAGGALLAFPSLLAACGGGGGGGSSDGGELKDVLEFSNWELYIDTPSLRKAAGMTGPTTLDQFDDEDGNHGQLLRGHQRQPRVLRDGAGPARAGKGDRTGHHRLDRQRQVPRRVPGQRLGAEAGQEPHPEHLEPHRRAGEPPLRPEPRLHAAVVLRHGRDRLERGRDRPGDDREATFRRPGPEGESRRLGSDGRHPRPHHARRTATTPRRSRTSPSIGRSPR